MIMTTTQPTLTEENTNTSSWIRHFVYGYDITMEICGKQNISFSECRCDVFPFLCHTHSPLTTHSPEHNDTFVRTYERSSSVTIGYASMSLLVSLLGVFANASVLRSAYRQSVKLSPCKLHISELAVVNFLFSIVQMINIVPLYWTNRWLLSLSMCIFLRSFLEVASFMTVGLIQIIAYERYRHVVYPIDTLGQKGTLKHALVVTILIIVTISVLPYSLMLNIENHSGRCAIEYHTDHQFMLWYNSSIVALYSIIPICVLTVLSIRMVLQLHHRRESGSFSRASIARHRVKLRNRRVSYITLSILFFFILCTLPTRIITLYIDTMDGEEVNVHDYLVLTMVSYFTYPLQNTLNPILFNMTARKIGKYKKTLKKTFGSFGSEKETVV